MASAAAALARGAADPGAAGDADPRVAQWRAIKRAAMDAVVAHGGTSTHHNAVGKLHAPWYAREGGALAEPAWRALKHAHDPRAVLNPGVLFPSPRGRL